MTATKQNLFWLKLFGLFSVVRGYNILVIIIAQYLASIFILASEKSTRSVVLDYRLFLITLRLEKLLKSAIHNFESKTGETLEPGSLVVKSVAVDSGRMLKRVQPAPQGRAHRVRKRSNHVTLFVDKLDN